MIISTWRSASDVITAPPVLIANPENRRVAGFLEACRRQGFPVPVVLAWEDVLKADFPLEEKLLGQVWLRLDSPGENFNVERQLIALGAQAAARENRWPWLSAHEAVRLMPDHGRLRWQRQWYHGWMAALRRIERAARSTGISTMNAPREIAVMFDKSETQSHLAAASVPVPRQLGICQDFEYLRHRMREAGLRQVFVKPCHSSSASGVVALRTDGRGRWQAVTSAVLETDGGDGAKAVAGFRLRNSLRLQVIRKETEVAKLINALAGERLMAEEWIPKDSLAGRTYDLRVLVIGGQATHVVVRSSRSPLTNLHLGNERGDPDLLKTRLGTQRWQTAMGVAEAAARAFPRSHYAGVDLMVDVSRKRFIIAEVNAFGDLLPRVLWRGLDTWEAELALWRQSGG